YVSPVWLAPVPSGTGSANGCGLRGGGSETSDCDGSGAVICTDASGAVIWTDASGAVICTETAGGGALTTRGACTSVGAVSGAADGMRGIVLTSELTPNAAGLPRTSRSTSASSRSTSSIDA